MKCSYRFSKSILTVPANSLDFPQDIKMLGWCTVGLLTLTSCRGGHHLSSVGVTIKMPYGVDVLLH